jgi:hypothetical protein
LRVSGARARTIPLDEVVAVTYVYGVVPVLPAVAFMPVNTAIPPPPPRFVLWSNLSVMLDKLALDPIAISLVELTSLVVAMDRTIKQSATDVVTAGNGLLKDAVPVSALNGLVVSTPLNAILTAAVWSPVSATVVVLSAPVAHR